MSSHREAPEISKDPVADNTDVYAFVSPDRPDTVTLIANFIPLQKPDGGPNFYEFGDDVVYRIHVANKGKAESDVVYEFAFHTKVRNARTFLYNTGPISRIDDATWNRPQYYSLTRIADGRRVELAHDLPCPPVNVGVRSTPDYESLAEQAFVTLGSRKVFAGQRAEGFHVDLGSIFDLGTLRPFEELHLIPSAAAVGVDATKTYNVHTIAIQTPISDLVDKSRSSSKPSDPGAVIGVWASAWRRKSRIIDNAGRVVGHGPWVQVSRLGNPLFNEVINPMAQKDEWNARPPKDDATYAGNVNHPELAKLLPVLYPGSTFRNLAAYAKPRADLHAILLTGIPQLPALPPGYVTFTGPVEADMLRLNTAIPPSRNPRPLGILDPDHPDQAGFPNGRRVIDDTTTVELRAIAGATIPLVDPTFTPDGAAGAVTDGTSNTGNFNGDFRDTFPYLATPNGGYQTTPGTSSPSKAAAK